MRRGHLVCVRSRECELTRLAADRFIEGAAGLRDRYIAPTTCSTTRAVNSQGDKNTSASVNAAEMDTNDLAFACGAVGNRGCTHFVLLATRTAGKYCSSSTAAASLAKVVY